MIPRVVVIVAGVAALALPLPAADPLGVGLTLTGLVALGVSVARPGSGAPALLIAAAALSWLFTPDGEAHALRLAGLALTLALVHASAALAAVVPARARVPAGLLVRWAGRTVLATALGAGLVAAVSAVPASVGPAWPSVVAVLAVGLLAAVSAAIGLAAGRRRGPAGDHGGSRRPGCGVSDRRSRRPVGH